MKEVEKLEEVEEVEEDTIQLLNLINRLVCGNSYSRVKVNEGRFTHRYLISCFELLKNHH